MKKLLFLFSILLFISCSKEGFTTYKEMKSDKLLSKSFTDNELENLAKIIDFFEEQICEKGSNKERCYRNFLKKDSIKLVNENEMYWFDYKKQEKLYSDLDSTFLQSFWDKGYGDSIITINPEKRIKYDYFHLKVYNDVGFTKYAKFIQKFGLENQFIKEYYKSIEMSNEFFTPITPISLTINHNNFNKKDIKIRIIYSFHYLNINEYYSYIQKQKL